MKHPASHLLSFGILAAAIFAACLGMLVPTSAAQTSGKSGAEKVGESKPTAAAKTGEKAGAKPQADAPKKESPTVVKEAPPAVKETPKPKVESSDPPPVAEPEKPASKVVPKTSSPEKVAPVVSEAKSQPKPAAPTKRQQGLMAGLTIFVLAIFVGVDVINRVPTTLHTPLMSGSNAISGITAVGALIAAGQGFHFSSFLGFFAVALAMINVVGGFLVTHRMLLMFKRK